MKLDNRGLLALLGVLVLGLPVVAMPLVLLALDARPSSFRSRFTRDRDALLARVLGFRWWRARRLQSPAHRYPPGGTLQVAAEKPGAAASMAIPLNPASPRHTRCTNTSRRTSTTASTIGLAVVA